MKENPNYHQQWATCYATVGDHFSHVLIDLGYLRLLPMPDKRNTLMVAVLCNTSDEDGLPNDEEIAVLTRIGEVLDDSLNTSIDAAYVGFIASDKQCRFCFCTESASTHEQIISEALKQFPEYRHESHVLEDDNWDIYTECLFDVHQHYECIQHSTVVTRFEEDGDSLTTPRPVDHWFYFRKESDRARFIERVGKEGFQIQNCDSDDGQDGEFPFVVNVSRMDSVDLQSVFKYTSFLWNIAYEHYGIYDGWGAMAVKEE